MAVFGVPVVHEDDALRAARAAVEMLAALPELGVEARIGIETGEVMSVSEEWLVTGDAANVAARLQAAATPGEIWLGAGTLELVRGSATVEELSPLELKGKRRPVAVYRLLAVQEVPERRHGALFVGRAEELAFLRRAWTRAVDGERCELVTIVGEAGVGKSRLVAELALGLDASVVRGGCLSYGEGITYWPVVEVIKKLDARPRDAAAAAAIAALLGESDAATSPEEIAWAFRKLLEAHAPLVVVFDDVQWGEDTFLDLVEQVALLSTGAPLLVLCLARPELSERRPQWPIALRLGPLPASDVEVLLPGSAPRELRERIAHAAGGNPLFLTEMLAVAAESAGEVVVPPTLKALLAMRLDQLDEAERSVLESGAVEGESFHRGAVQALARANAQVSSQLAGLVRKELIRPERPRLPGEDGFRFCHLLIRDAAYAALPKSTRAELHERFADWLDEHATTLVERHELLAYHLEQAHGYRTELGFADEATRTLGERAATSLAAAAQRAAERDNRLSQISLLQRALALAIDPGERAQLQLGLGGSLAAAGRKAESGAVLAEALDAAAALGERGIAAHARLLLRGPYALAHPDDRERWRASVDDAIETFTELGDDRGLALARDMLAWALITEGREEDAFVQLDLALGHARASSDWALRRGVTAAICLRLCNGPTPVGEALDRCVRLLESVRDDPVLQLLIKRYQATLYAMAARVDEALELLREGGRVVDEFDPLYRWRQFSARVATVKELVGDRAGAEAERRARWSYLRDRHAEAIDMEAVVAAVALALFCCDEGRWDDAAELIAYVEDVPLVSTPAHPYDAPAISRRVVEARLAAHHGRLDEALAIADRAAIAAEQLSNLNRKAELLVGLAEVWRAAGRTTEADAAIASTLEFYEQKGNVAAAAQLRATVLN
jgi:hypothetical protein